MANLDELAENIIKGQAPAVEQLTEKALAEGESPESVLRNGLIKGMDVVGAKFKANEFYVPEVLIAARAMKAGMKILRPRLAESGVQPVGRLYRRNRQGRFARYWQKSCGDDDGRRWL